MKLTGTLHDAAIVFSALRGKQVITLLSRLDVQDAQRMLATAAKLNPSAIDFHRTGSRLAQSLSSATPETAIPEASTASLDFIIKLSDSEVQRLLAAVNTACWAPSLRPEPHSIRDVVYQNVAPAVATILKQEVAEFGGTLSESQTSCLTICKAAAKLGLLSSQQDLKKAG